LATGESLVEGRAIPALRRSEGGAKKGRNRSFAGHAFHDEPLPEFALKDVAGKSWLLSDIREKKTLITVWRPGAHRAERTFHTFSNCLTESKIGRTFRS
jgi:hypothetical protein